MQSSDPRRFFETDAEQAKREKRAVKASNKFGSPIALKSKIVAAVVDPSSPSSTVFIAESAGTVRRVNVDDEGTGTVYRGPTAPVTSVAVGGSQDKTVFAGSWDKNIWSWDIDSRSPGRKYVGHSDFVKAIICAKVGGKNVLISGGSDKRIIVWDIDTGIRLHTLQDSGISMLAVQGLVIDPVQSSPDELYLVSASSDPHIRRWRIRLDSWEQVVEGSLVTPGSEQRTILVHETGVYKLVFDHDGEEVDLWTSSADGTAKCLSRLKNFSSEDSFNHGDHVRAMAVSDEWVITAGRDEDLKFWERTSGKVSYSLEGHYDEVTDLVVLKSPNRRQDRLCSVSIDGTVRTWPLEKGGLDAVIKEQEEAKIEKNKENETDTTEENLLTADEEAELAALMDDD
ncbi:putative wd repeat-containing protein [Phaeoacremonium minimum UCRPA7]|uniref:Putative wd repeat-containing protein n=1 Tax=Phaeoacremonium minimum (strain UCR-PA7) TaxID=1286976 RepID=R8BWC7_PHAM7|nr:putative wd repeat-containing protein [Phaeoacremonium minimum UCRPA7]EOO03614.1 putative wd repeat-containing protein [Phaeoacremonium minimum UCRPA7]